MKRLVPGFVVCLSLSFNVATHAQTNETSTDDASAVRTTVTNYIEAYCTADARRMKQTLDPHDVKHMIHGDIPIRKRTGLQMVHDVRANYGASIPLEQRT